MNTGIVGRKAFAFVAILEVLSIVPLAIYLPFSAVALVFAAGILAALNASMFVITSRGVWFAFLEFINLVRSRLVSSRTQLASQVRGLLAEYGIDLPPHLVLHLISLAHEENVSASEQERDRGSVFHFGRMVALVNHSALHHK